VIIDLIIMMKRFPPLWKDRAEAGRALADALCHLKGRSDLILVALPRGGVPVAAAMAERLEAPVVPWAVRKLVHPSNPEYAIGAIAPGGIILWDERHQQDRFLSQPSLREQLVHGQEIELERRRRIFNDPSPSFLRGKHLVVVDDGIATGMTVKAALASLRQAGPASLTLAVPVVDRRIVPELRALVDAFEALAVVDHLRSVGEWYRLFPQLEDEEVLQLLRHHRPPAASIGTPST
jgi:putative phosphoribosyl transferase